MSGIKITEIKTVLVKHTGEGGPVRISAQSISPAKDAAEKLARRMYGKRGTVGALRFDSSAADGSSSTYEAFIGSSATKSEMKRGMNGITGRNVWIYV
jgi:hypothetical protein